MAVKGISLKHFSYTFLMVTFVTAVIYYYPRYLVQTLGDKSPWLGFLYTYGLGFFLSSLSVLLIFTQKKSLLRKKEENLWLMILFLGLLFYFLMQGFWIMWAIKFPLKI
ncbi:MAG: hypothetical protein ACR2M7_05260 [Bdellovibrionales bacterium]